MSFLTDIDDLKGEVKTSINAINQLSVSLHQKLASNDAKIQEVLTEVHNDYLVLANALDSFMRYVMSEDITDDEKESLVGHINAFLNRG